MFQCSFVHTMCHWGMNEGGTAELWDNAAIYDYVNSSIIMTDINDT